MSKSRHHFASPIPQSQLAETQSQKHTENQSMQKSMAVGGPVPLLPSYQPLTPSSLTCAPLPLLGNPSSPRPVPLGALLGGREPCWAKKSCLHAKSGRWASVRCVNFMVIEYGCYTPAKERNEVPGIKTFCLCLCVCIRVALPVIIQIMQVMGES